MNESLTNSKQILQEIKRIITQPKNKDNEAISLYDVVTLQRKQENRLKELEKVYEDRFDCLIKYGFGRNYVITLHKFDYQTNELVISFTSYYSIKMSNIYFKKKGMLYVSKTETSSSIANKVLAFLREDLSELYDEYITYKNNTNQINRSFKSLNSQFYVNIDKYGADIFWFNYPINSFVLSDFKLSMHSYTNKVDFISNSTSVIDEFKGNEVEFFKKIFVKITDCPKWMQEQLYEIRQNQLAEEQRIEDEKKYQEMKKQKRLELRNKIFPFLKK